MAELKNTWKVMSYDQELGSPILSEGDKFQIDDYPMPGIVGSAFTGEGGGERPIKVHVGKHDYDATFWSEDKEDQPKMFGTFSVRKTAQGESTEIRGHIARFGSCESIVPSDVGTFTAGPSGDDYDQG
jgi:hypothetical protein